jgi:hypothetical protein
MARDLDHPRHEAFERGDVGESEVPRALLLIAGRPADGPRARSLAGLRWMTPSRTASSSTRTIAATVFLTVERPYLVSHSSMARPTRPAVIIATGG